MDYGMEYGVNNKMNQGSTMGHTKKKKGHTHTHTHSHTPGTGCIQRCLNLHRLVHSCVLRVVSRHRRGGRVANWTHDIGGSGVSVVFLTGESGLVDWEESKG